MSGPQFCMMHAPGRSNLPPRGEQTITPDLPPSLGKAVLVGVQGEPLCGAARHRVAAAQGSNQFIPGRYQHFGPQPEWDSLGLEIGRRSGAAPVVSAFVAVRHLAAEHFPANQADGCHRLDAGAIRSVAGIEDAGNFARDRIDELGVSFTVVGWPAPPGWNPRLAHPLERRGDPLA